MPRLLLQSLMAVMKIIPFFHSLVFVQYPIFPGISCRAASGFRLPPDLTFQDKAHHALGLWHFFWLLDGFPYFSDGVGSHIYVHVFFSCFKGRSWLQFCLLLAFLWSFKPHLCPVFPQLLLPDSQDFYKLSLISSRPSFYFFIFLGIFCCQHFWCWDFVLSNWCFISFLCWIVFHVPMDIELPFAVFCNQCSPLYLPLSLLGYRLRLSFGCRLLQHWPYDLIFKTFRWI